MIDEIFKSIMNSITPDSYMIEFYNVGDTPIVVYDGLNGVKFRVCNNKYIIMPLRFDDRDIQIHTNEYLSSILSYGYYDAFLRNHILISYDDNLNVSNLNKMKDIFSRKIKEYDALRLLLFNRDTYTWEVKDDRYCNTFGVD